MACLWIPSGCIKNVNLGGKQLNYYACLFAAILIILRQHLWRCCHLTTMPLCTCVCINGLVLFSIPNFNDVYISAHAQMYIFANVPKIRGPTVGEHRISLRLDRRTRTGNVYWAIRDFTGCQPQVLTGETSWFNGDFMVISWGLHGATCWHVIHFLLPSSCYSGLRWRQKVYHQDHVLPGFECLERCDRCASCLEFFGMVSDSSPQKRTCID